MSAVPRPQPHNDDEQSQPWPLTPELIGDIIGVEKPKRLLTKQHIRELERRGRDMREGLLHIKIRNGQVIAIGDTRFNLFDID